MKQKIIFLVADGMGDRPIDALSGKTPLEAAATPHMDALAPHAQMGLCASIPPGMPPGSDIANMGLLGYAPQEFYTGRGPIEAAAQEIQLEDNDLVYRLNLCTVSEFSVNGIMLDYCAGHIPTAEAKKLLQRLSKHLPDRLFSIHPGLQYRHLLVHKGGLHSAQAKMQIHPPHDILNQSIRADIQAYSQSKTLWEILKTGAKLLATQNQTKANALWPWGQGGKIQMPPFKEKFNMHGVVISAVDLIKGLGKASGMQVPNIPGATGLLDTNYQGKIEAAVEFLQHGDFVYLHIEAPDECGHEGSLENKIEAIQRFDRNIVGPILKYTQDLRPAILITCDHFTPISVRTHTKEAVPYLFYNPLYQPTETGREFSEKLAERSGMMIESGELLLPWVQERLNWN